MSELKIDLGDFDLAAINETSLKTLLNKIEEARKDQPKIKFKKESDWLFIISIALLLSSPVIGILIGLWINT